MADASLSLSPYIYCGDNPLSRIDPEGLFFNDIWQTARGIFGKIFGKEDESPGDAWARIISQRIAADFEQNMASSLRKIENASHEVTPEPKAHIKNGSYNNLKAKGVVPIEEDWKTGNEL